MDTALEELLARAHSWNREGEGWVRLDRVEIQEENIVLELTLAKEEPETGPEHWTVRAEEVFGFRFQGEQYGGAYPLDFVEIADDAPLLREYTEPHYKLGFLGKPRDGTALCLALVHILESMTPYRYGRPAVSITPAFYEAGHGFAGSGPESLMRACFLALEAAGVEPYLLPAYNPHQERIAEATKTGALRLFTIGNAFIAANQFILERVETVLPTEV